MKLANLGNNKKKKEVIIATNEKIISPLVNNRGKFSVEYSYIISKIRYPIIIRTVAVIENPILIEKIVRTAK